MALQIQGVTELIRQIEQMGRRVDDHVKEKALLAGAEIFRDKAKDLAPARPGSGKLRDNIIVSDIDTENNVIHVGPAQQGPAFYGHFLELGTSKMPAKPFLGPTYENNKEAVQNKMAEVVRRELGL